MKVALVTGAASGIGQALAELYARRGVAVVGGYFANDVYDPGVTQSLVEAAGGKCIMVPVDVSSDEQTEVFAESALETFGRLDYVVANAGLIRFSPLTETTDAKWMQMVDVNLSGVMRTIRAGVRRISEGGAMVAVSSFHGSSLGFANISAYAAAKAGVVGFCRAVSIEYAPRNIRLNAVVPGVIETPQTLDPVNSIGRAGLDDMAHKIPFHRVGKAVEVANLISYLTSDESSYITGQQIAVDGGLIIGGKH